MKNCGKMSLSSSRLRIWYFEAWTGGEGSEGSRRWAVVQPSAWAWVQFRWESSVEDGC